MEQGLVATSGKLLDLEFTIVVIAIGVVATVILRLNQHKKRWVDGKGLVSENHRKNKRAKKTAAPKMDDLLDHIRADIEERS